MNETGKNFISIRDATKITGLHPNTLRKFADQNQVKCYKTPSGQRKFDRQSLEKFCNPVPIVVEISNNEKINYIYSRVSSKKQLDDLSRQIDYLHNYKPEYASYVSLSDVASGINFKRKGLQVILDACLQQTIGELVIAHRDRLCRFGFELIQCIVEKSGGKITILDDEQNKSTEQELSEDLLSIIHIYSCKQMGKRSYKSKQQLKILENKIEINPESEENS
jgi:putative resolvase